MKQLWLMVLTVASLIGMGCSGETPSEPTTESVAITIEKTQAGAPAPAPESGAVHSGRPMPGQMAGKLPAGHPPLPGKASALPSGHPPIAGQAAGVSSKPRPSAPFMRPPSGPSDGGTPPLESGDHSPAADLNAGLEALGDSTQKGNFEEGFRKTFTLDRSKRDYDGAEQVLLQVLEAHPNHPQALRAMGYVAVNQGFNVEKAMKYYGLSVEKNPDYGPGHYALAFMYARGDRGKGAEHFKKAIDLGLPDARGIGPRFYPASVQK